MEGVEGKEEKVEEVKEEREITVQDLIKHVEEVISLHREAAKTLENSNSEYAKRIARMHSIEADWWTAELNFLKSEAKE